MRKLGKKQRVVRYARISYTDRLKIIEFICEKGYTIEKTAITLGINSSTARMILKKYKEKGTLFERKCEQQEREVIEQVVSSTDKKQNSMTERTSTISPMVSLPANLT